MAMQTMTRPKPALAALYEKMAQRFGTKAHPFGGFSMQPGVGTFASYVEQGLGCAASADGRLASQPLGTDMSPAPSPVDQPATPATRQLADAVEALEGLRSDDSFGYANGAPIDLNIDERMTEQRLVEILDAFTGGAGSNVLTVTAGDQEILLEAAVSPESFDLLRVRMGGWTEMFIAMHAAHQRVHPRRPFSV
jgi:pyruvate-formate lyase